MRPTTTALSADAVSNISRFFAYLIDNNVRFTVKGEIFKTTEKRILTDLIPNPGRTRTIGDPAVHLRVREALRFLEVTGERTFQLTGAGRDWEAQALDTKLGDLFQHITSDLDLEHESVHQIALRRCC